MAFGFMLPILAGFIAMSIADRPGLVVGFVGGAIAASGTSFLSLNAGADPVSAGFLGALVAGFAGGYFVLLLKKATEKFPRALDGIRPMLIYPLIGTLFIGLLMFLINPVMGAINTWISNLLNSMGGSSKVVLGIVLGGMT